MYKRSRQGETSKLSSLHCARDVTNICGNVDVDVASGISASSGERTKGMVGGREVVRRTRRGHFTNIWE